MPMGPWSGRRKYPPLWLTTVAAPRSWFSKRSAVNITSASRGIARGTRPSPSIQSDRGIAKCQLPIVVQIGNRQLKIGNEIWHTKRELVHLETAATQIRSDLG